LICGGRFEFTVYKKGGRSSLALLQTEKSYIVQYLTDPDNAAQFTVTWRPCPLLSISVLFLSARVIQVLAGGKRGSANRHSDKAAIQIDIWTIISNYEIDYLL